MTEIAVTPPITPNFAAVKAGKIKLTRQEQFKLEKDGLDVLDDMLNRFPKEGFTSISEDDFDRMKWYGFYRQRPKDSGYFMQRLKIPGGQYTSQQGKLIANFTAEFARGFLDVTTRQTFQMHWLKIEHFKILWEMLKSVGMTTSGACGDDTRNVVGCPAAGIDPRELFDASPYNLAINKMITDNRDFSNLPRKFKISVSGCAIRCAQPDINCLSFFGVKRKDGTIGFGVMVGGGLSTAPHLAQILPVFVPLDEKKVLDVAYHISALYRDEGYRANRTKARLKFLVADWGAQRFTEELEKRLGYKLELGEEWEIPKDQETDHFGINPQKQEGLNYIGVSCLGGRLQAVKLKRLCEIAETYGNGRLRNTNKQNILILDVPTQKIESAKKELDAAGLIYEASNFRKGGISCTGIEFCNLAVSETKNRLMLLVEELEAMKLDNDKIRIHFSGCPSSCGQHQIADIGFRGTKIKIDGQQVDAFEMFIGGRLGGGRRFNELIKSKVPSKDLHLVIKKLLEFYKANRLNEESFGDFCVRTPREQVAAALH